MPSNPTHWQNSDGPNDSGAWRICCISPNRLMVEGLSPALKRCFPGASVCDVRHYPEKDSLADDLGSPLPDVCFVDVISDRARPLSLIPQILQLDGRINIIVLIGAKEPDLILKCLRLGASEFLEQPFDAGQLLAALPRLTRAGTAGADQKQLAKVYCVVPAKGACGSTTVACNLAFQFKRGGSNRILLADMDPLTGTVSFLLKVKSGDYSFVDVLSRAETLDADLWRGMIASTASIDVLLAPESMLQGLGGIVDASPIVDFARKIYDVVILDTSSAYGEWNVSQARACDEVLLVTTNELPALHGAQKSIYYLEANRVPRWKIKLIVNRFDPAIGLNEDLIANALHTDVIQTIPSDYEAVQKALIDGKAVPANTPLGKTFAALADKLAGREKERPVRKAPAGGLLSLFSRPS
jgi:pilus assembly protein CpaE